MRDIVAFSGLLSERSMDGRPEPNARGIAGAPAGGPAADDDEIAALRAIVEGTARATGEAFFQSLVRHLAAAVGVGYAFVAEFAGGVTRGRPIASWGPGGVAPAGQRYLEREPAALSPT